MKQPQREILSRLCLFIHPNPSTNNLPSGKFYQQRWLKSKFISEYAHDKSKLCMGRCVEFYKYVSLCMNRELFCKLWLPVSALWASFHFQTSCMLVVITSKYWSNVYYYYLFEISMFHLNAFELGFICQWKIIYFCKTSH